MAKVRDLCWACWACGLGATAKMFSVQNISCSSFKEWKKRKCPLALKCGILVQKER